MKTHSLKTKHFASFLIANLFFITAALAQTNTWDGSNSNNWNDGANWSLNTVPTSAHDVVININAAINVDANATINSLTISNSAVVSFTSSGSSSRTITIDNNGSSIGAGSSLTLNGSTGSGTRSMTIAFSGSSRTMSIAGTLIVTNTGDGAFYTATNSLTTVTGTLRKDDGTITSTATNLTISSGGTYDHAMDGGSIVTATWSAGSTCLVSGLVSSLPGAMDQSFANLTWNSPAQTGNFSLAGDISNVNGNFNMVSTGTGSMRLVNGPGGSNLLTTVTGNFTQSGGTFYIMGTSSSSGSQTLRVNGNVSITGGTLQMSGNSLVGTLDVKGNFSHTGGTITESSTGSGVISFTGTGAQTITGGGTVSNDVDYVLNNTGSGLTLGSAYTIHSNSQLTLTDGVITTTAANVLIFADNATVSGASNNSYVDGPVTKIGNDNFTFPVGDPAGSYHQIVLNNTAAANASATVTDSYTAEYFRANPLFKGPIASGSGLTAISNCEYWELVRNAGSGSPSVSVSWTADSPCGSNGYVTTTIGLVVAWLNGSNQWQQAPGTSTNISGNTTAGTVQRTGVGSFGFFALASVNPAGSPLPVKFSGFDAKKEAAGVKLTWKVEAEENLAGYQVERSNDGVKFATIGTVQAEGRNAYSFVDGQALTSKVFYRIKSMDIDGKYQYSPIVSLIGGKSSLVLKAFPMPVVKQVTIQHTAANASTRISITSQDGRVIKSIIPANGSIQTVVDLSSANPGLYFVRFDNGNGETETLKIMKQ